MLSANTEIAAKRAAGIIIPGGLIAEMTGVALAISSARYFLGSRSCFPSLSILHA